MKKIPIIFLSILYSFSLINCQLFNTISDDIKGTDYNAQIKKVSLSKNSLSINEGESIYKTYAQSFRTPK